MEFFMALVKCAECSSLVSNKTMICPYCGYSPRGTCKTCRWFAGAENFCNGRCFATDEEFVKEYKSACPAILKKF